VIRLLALWAALVATMILILLLREERMAKVGKVPLGRMRRFWFQSDRRGAPHYRLDWTIRYQRLGAELYAQAQTRDVSQMGAGLLLRERLEIGDEIQLELSPPGNPDLITVTGRVVWIREIPQRRKIGQGERFFATGIQFQGISSEMEKRLSALLGKAKRLANRGRG